MLNEEVAKVIGENVRRYRKEKGVYTRKISRRSKYWQNSNIQTWKRKILTYNIFHTCNITNITYWINIFFYRSITYKNGFANYVKLCYNKFVTILES